MAKTTAARSADLQAYLERLQRAFLKVPPREEDENALERLMALILQDEQAYSIGRKAVKHLGRTYANWNECRVARLFEVRLALESKRIADAEKRADLAQEFLRRVFGLQNHLDLDWLYDATTERREKLLTSLTMAPLHCGPVLDLDAAVADNESLPPITTDLKRLFARLGLVPSNPKDVQVLELAGPFTEGEDLYPNFLALQMQARAVCESKHPRCRQCPLLDVCPHGKKLLGPAVYKSAMAELGLGAAAKSKKATAKKASAGKKAVTSKKTASKKKAKKKASKKAVKKKA